jgi:hypothetical protein
VKNLFQPFALKFNLCRDKVVVLGDCVISVDTARRQVGLHSLSPGGCQICYVDHAGCHQWNRVLTAQSKRNVKSA